MMQANEAPSVERGLEQLRVPQLSPSRSTGAQIHAVLKAAILSMDLLPGQRLPEQEIGARFGASRTPVREALQRLRSEDLIVTWPSRGNFVSRLSESRIREAQYIREALELANVQRLCSIGLDPQTAKTLQATLDAQDDAIKRADDLAFQEQDDLFHALLARATGHKRAETLLLQEKSALDRLRSFSLNTPLHSTRLHREHQGVLNAIVEQNIGAARDAMREHLRSVLDLLSGLIENNKDLFDDSHPV